MKVVALVSGGKDSCFNMMECIKYGHEIVAVANLHPADEQVDELDSFMFQTCGHNLIASYSECMGVPCFRHPLNGKSVAVEMHYTQTANDEVEDLFQLLSKVKKAMPAVQAVSSGAILSNYQRIRVENVCERLGLVSLAYLWQRDQTEVLSAMIDADINAVLIKTSSMGLDKRHLGQSIKQLYPYLTGSFKEMGCNEAGEGGEYETLTLDCPLFTKNRIVIDEFEYQGDEAEDLDKGPVCYYKVLKFHLEAKVIDNKNKEMDGNDDDTQSDDVKTKQLAATTEKKTAAPTTTTIDVPVTSVAAPSVPPPISSPLPFTPINSSDALAFISTAPFALSPSDASTAAQVEAVLKHIYQQLQANDLCLDDVFYMHLFIDDMGKFKPINDIYKAVFALENPPSRSCVELPLAQGQQGKDDNDVTTDTNNGGVVKVVADCMAIRQSCISRSERQERNIQALDKFTASDADAETTAKASSEKSAATAAAEENENKDPHNSKRVLHVQSISSWAPSCIGPYSQNSEVGYLLFLAGQIGLDPATMVLKQDPALQIQQVFWNCKQVLEILKSDFDHMLSCVIFVGAPFNTPQLGPLIKEECLKAVPVGFHSRLCFVVVPRLPRDAIIEARVVAYRKELDDMWSCKLQPASPATPASTLTPAVQEVSSSADELLAVTSVQTTSLALDTDIKEVAGQAVEALLQRLTATKLSRERLFTLRVYVDVSLCPVSCDTLRELLSEAFESCDTDGKAGVVPAMSFLPISALSLSAPNTGGQAAPFFAVQSIAWDFKAHKEELSIASLY